MGIISDLYNGRSYPFEGIVYSGCAGYKEVLTEIIELEENFSSKLNAEEKNLFQNLLELYADKIDMELEQTFVYAFRLGAILQIDIYGK